MLASGVALVLLSVVARTRSNGKYEVKTGDLVLLIIPLLLVALATGKVQGLDLFGVKAGLSALWVKAASTRRPQSLAGTSATPARLPSATTRRD